MTKYDEDKKIDYWTLEAWNKSASHATGDEQIIMKQVSKACQILGWCAYFSRDGWLDVVRK